MNFSMTRLQVHPIGLLKIANIFGVPPQSKSVSIAGRSPNEFFRIRFYRATANSTEFAKDNPSAWRIQGQRGDVQKAVAPGARNIAASSGHSKHGVDQSH
jgi:hypothetical protein